MSQLGLLLPALVYLGIVAAGLAFVLRRGLAASWGRLALAGLALLGASSLLTLWLSGTFLPYAPISPTDSAYRALGLVGSFGHLTGLGLLVAAVLSGRPGLAQPAE
jgi:hypothetical protein